MTLLLDVAIGLALVYFLGAMLNSSVMEILARMVSARGRLLREGLTSLVPDRWLYLRLINHPMVAGLYRGRPGTGSPPSYLPARNFVLALVDTLMLRQRMSRGTELPLSLANLKEAVRGAKARDLGIGHALLPIVEAAPDLETALKQMDAWYESAMDRVTGWYKAYAQKRLFLIGLVVAVGFNIDTLEIATALSRSAESRAIAVAAAERLSGGEASAVDAKAELKALDSAGLPLGYACANPNPGHGMHAKADWLCDCYRATLATEGGNLILKCLGWLLTALATTLGAPFWFDAMKRLVNLRGAGPKPNAGA